MPRNDFVEVAFWVFIAIYVTALVISPALGPTDDFIFLRTLQTGKPLLYYQSSFPYYDTASTGHFQILSAMEYNLVALVRNTPFAYFFVHALQFVILVVVLKNLLARVIPRKRIVLGVITLLLLLPGFTFAWFKLQMNERNALFFIILFLWCYFHYREKPHTLTLFAGLLAANAAIHYKEMIFVVIGGFAFFRLIFTIRENDRTRFFDVALLVSAVIFLFLYAVLILPLKGVFSYGVSPAPLIPLLAKLFLNYTFLSDPFLMLLIVPLVLMRTWKIFIRKEKIEALYDAMLFSVPFYILGFFVLRLYGYNYFLPIYPFAIIPFAFFAKDYFRTLKIPGIACAIIFATNSIPAALHTATYNIYLSKNFTETLNTVSQGIAAGRDRPRIFLSGFKSGSGNWTYFIFSEFFRAKGFSPDQFDLVAEERDITEPKNQPLPIAIPQIALPYSVYTADTLVPPRKGDYLIVSPLSTDPYQNPDNELYIQSLVKNYDLVLKTKSLFAIPMFTAKELGRTLLSINSTPDQKFFGVSRKKPRFETPDFYVFMRK